MRIFRFSSKLFERIHDRSSKNCSVAINKKIENIDLQVVKPISGSFLLIN